MSNETPEHLVSFLRWLRKEYHTDTAPWDATCKLYGVGGVHYGLNERKDIFAHVITEPGCSYCEVTANA